MKTAELCQMLAQAIAKVQANEMETTKAQTLLGLANSMTRARRLQMDYNRTKVSGTTPVNGLD